MFQPIPDHSGAMFGRDSSLKIVLAGPQNAGKTAFMSQVMHAGTQTDFAPTIGYLSFLTSERASSAKTWSLTTELSKPESGIRLAKKLITALPLHTFETPAVSCCSLIYQSEAVSNLSIIG